ncbi:GGDEF domain-containing protein [Pelagibacterium halotolerans]|uniref:GGDEF domain-containing protein n=1 Tax=Pelagibacterium halotolerans TaxID=531813 RepID=UPI00384F90E2
MRTLRHLAFAVLASVIVSYAILETFSNGLGMVGLVAAIVAPLGLAGPMVFFMALKHKQLEIAYERLEAAAARDSLTQCLNHGAFVTEVSTLLAEAQGKGGGLLVIDADHFKSINDRFGHACGDTALKMIAATIRSVVRETDIVGRLGGEEFGIFLPGAGEAVTRIVAQDLRLRIRAITFDIGGETCSLSVSIGGAVSEGPAAFGDLFRYADAQLYAVKNAGRDNVEVMTFPASPTLPAAANAPTLMYRGQRVVNS